MYLRRFDDDFPHWIEFARFCCRCRDVRDGFSEIVAGELMVSHSIFHKI